MSAWEPKSGYDLDGWEQVTCWQAEIIRRRDLIVASSHTDVEMPDVFTEWWAIGEQYRNDVPVLREYRDRDGCRHYLAHEPERAASLTDLGRLARSTHDAAEAGSEER